MKTVDEYWASFFGLSVADFMKHGTRVVPHAGLEGYEGVWLFRRGLSRIISVPPRLVEHLSAAFHPRRGNLADADFVASLGGQVEKVIGPAYQGCLEATEFHPVVSRARLLSEADDTALRELAAACDAEEWEHSDIQIGHPPIFGVYTDGHLAAASTYRMETKGVAMPGIITHPHYRGQGYGKAVLSAATKHGLGQGQLMLYQTLISNMSAISAAEKLGYKQYATHLAVRLHP